MSDDHFNREVTSEILAKDKDVRAFANVLLEFLEDHPDIEQSIKENTARDGMSVEHFMLEWIGVVHHLLEQPFPPALREYLIMNSSDIIAGLRKILVTPNLN